MIDTQEPKDGDFIAYIEQLQKESAARLLGSNQHLITQLEKKPSSGAADSHFFAGRKPADLRSAAQLQAAVAQVASRADIGQLIYSTLPIAIGFLLAFYWLLASASTALLIVAIGLIVWGIRRITRALRKLSPQQTPSTVAPKVFSAYVAKPAAKIK